MKKYIAIFCVLAFVSSNQAYAGKSARNVLLGVAAGVAIGTLLNKSHTKSKSDRSIMAGAYRNQSEFIRKQLQIKLSERGLYNSKIDGQWGPGTRTAFQTFAEESGNIHLLTSSEGANELMNLLLSPEGDGQPGVNPRISRPSVVKNYIVNKHCSDKETMVTSVTTTSHKTLVRMKHELSQDMPNGYQRETAEFPPGHPKALSIVDAQSGKRYRLIDLSGIAIQPNTNVLVNKGDKVEYTLIFEKVPMRRFHVISGGHLDVVKGQMMDSWATSCLDIDLNENYATSPAAGTMQASDENQIPDKFIGVWAKDIETCNIASPVDNKIRITKNNIEFYEAHGSVRKVNALNENEIDIQLSMSGEGEVWTSTKHLTVAPDRRYLLETVGGERRINIFCESNIFASM